jgi:hypothetical protein
VATSSRLPIYLFQVLEQEFAALHDDPEPNEITVSLPNADGEFREVVPTYNWTFDASHIRNVEKFVLELHAVSPLTDTEASQSAISGGLFARIKLTLRSVMRRIVGDPQPTTAEDPDKVAKEKLINYLRERLTSRLEEGMTAEQWLANHLNACIHDEQFFSEERFSNSWLNSVTRGMREIHESFWGRLKGDDLVHFNRLLLEDAFPAHLEKIHNIRLAAIYKRIHVKKPTALCLSGGGIRSGTFALGMLQGLARHNLLNKFHYLSTVSGGGYIGSWLSAWIHRDQSGVEGVTAELSNLTAKTKVDPDPEPIRYLRRYSNFITPRVGLLSADTWTFIAIYLRNLLLNWLVFIPLLLAVLMLPRLVVSITSAEDQFSGGTFNVPGRYLFLTLGFVLTTWAIAYIMFNRPTVREELRQASPTWRKSSQRNFLVWCLLPLSIAAFSLTTHWAWSSQKSELPASVWPFLGFGVATTFLAWIVSSWVLGRIRTLRGIWRSLRRILARDLWFLVLAGLLGGLLLWALTQSYDPFAVGVMKDCSAIGPEWNLKAWAVEIFACLATPAFLLVFLLGATLYIGASSKSPQVDDEDREWWARLSAWVLIVILGWIIFTVLVIFGPLVLLSAPAVVASLGGISGILATLAGRSALTPGAPQESRGDRSEKRGVLSFLMGKMLEVAAVLFIAFLLITLALATTGILQVLANVSSAYLPQSTSLYLTHAKGFQSYLQCVYFNVPGADYFAQTSLAHMRVLHATPVMFLSWVAFGFLVVGGGLSLLMNLNIFSLHAGYRSRLIRAFLGASRPEQQRKPNPFTGFDPADNINMHELRPGLFDDDDFLDSAALAKVLLHPELPEVLNDYPNAAAVSRYLATQNLLNSLKSVPDPSCYSPRLVAALRRDLNAALQDPELSTEFAELATTQEGSAQSRLHISSNRAILQTVFSKWIKAKSGSEPYRLLPVINTTLNLVGGDNLAWQQRKAEPFSVTPLHAGCFRLGYRDARFYGGRETGGISIGTAAAISGAAASSNMGYYTTSPVLSLVLTFFNVRLGWWLGNPGTAGRYTYYQRAPNSSVKPIIDEALGLTDDENKYVYLTDGGHFENLGLYEMVLRRCHVIIVSDAAADRDYRFGDLGNAIRKVRIDLGIPIEFTALPIFRPEPQETRKGMYWALGRIKYKCIDGNVDDGLLIYIKPAVYGKEPGDVLEYGKTHPEFPHQSTADQFFDEPQFESYRVLGSHVMDQMCGDGNDELTLDAAIERAVQKLLDKAEGGPADPQLREWWEERQPPVAPRRQWIAVWNGVKRVLISNE